MCFDSPLCLPPPLISRQLLRKHLNLPEYKHLGGGGHATNSHAAPTFRSAPAVTIYRRLLIGRDGHLDQSEAYAIS